VKRGKNPYPGVSENVDRHGTGRWRFRKKGLPSVYLPGPYGSAAFRTAYDQALKGASAVSPSRRFEYGTFDWLIEQYYRSATWQKLAAITQKNRRADLERFRREHGSKRVALLRAMHVEALLSKKSETPAAANALLKLIRRLCRFAIRKGLIRVDPSIGVERYGENPDGFHTWTDDEVAQFEEHHGVDSKAVLAMRLVLYTGASRQDVSGLGWQNVKAGRIAYRRGKTSGEVDLPILDELYEVLSAVPADRMIFIVHSGAKPYKPTTFGNWFRDQCVAAGLPHCSSHGLRKAGATRLANAGANELEIMAFLGHTTPNEARTYIKKANRIRLADRGMERLISAKREQGVSNLVARLDKHRAKALKNQEK